MADVTLKRGKETLTVTSPTKAGLAALKRLGWEGADAPKRQARKPAAKK